MTLDQPDNSDRWVAAAYTHIDLAAHDIGSPEWEQADPIPITRYWSGDPAPPSRHAEARILWSPQALHVRFVCRQREPLIISEQPQTAKKVMGLWDRDVCEIFISPDTAVPERYFEFEAAPNGEWLDVEIRLTPNGRHSDWQFNSHLTTAANVGSDQLTVAMRIPWQERIPRPQPGERWRVNLFRCIGKDPDRGYLAWQPTQTAEPNFHVPQAFGWLVFA